MSRKCDGIYVFATEAVRSARNRRDFVDMLARRGIDIDVVASQDEAKLGFAGAYTDGVCCVLDIGGASSEIAVGDANGLTYAKSLPIGLVRIFDKCAEDIDLIDSYVADVIAQYGNVPKFDKMLANRRHCDYLCRSQRKDEEIRRGDSGRIYIKKKRRHKNNRRDI